MEDFVNKDFLSIAELSKDEIMGIFELSRDLKDKTSRRVEHHLLKGYTLAMIFAKPSARTRISFETGIFQLGGSALYLSPGDIGIGKREAVKDIARVISRYNDLIMARLFAHSDIEELAQYSRVPVINGLTDYNHPCQIMADAFTILEHLGTVENIKVAYIGDGNNVANSWINFASRIPMHLVICTPRGMNRIARRWKVPVKPGLAGLKFFPIPARRLKMPISYTPMCGPAWDRRVKPRSVKKCSSLTR